VKKTPHKGKGKPTCIHQYLLSSTTTPPQELLPLPLATITATAAAAAAASACCLGAGSLGALPRLLHQLPHLLTC